MSSKRATLALLSFAAICGAAAIAQPNAITGTYRGAFEGGEGEVKITGAAPRYHVNLYVGADGCSGSLDGPATLDARGRLTMSAPRDACHVMFVKNGTGWLVHEEACSNWHGAACTFDGAVKRVGP